MLAVVEEEQEYSVGPYRVLIRIRPDNPHFKRFVVMRGEKFLGNSFSRPDRSVCEWLERNRGGTLYASVSTYVRRSKAGNCELGKPRKPYSPVK